ncbi:Vitamin B12 import ATP-binding protein BtuD [Sinobacterium norvegicum]|uniref:Vitamin B12 import ATP-binding protein BtuD n=1 Tax=Sinobacterium norvegicum TaxID=1641715 RepID=A0ABN8EHH8_9GAMM|nr:molybdenum ABC transporter ATP-binding protein [Sinobacterium norvegicum]CAH0991893.1 Vitamin B12 import ATP-binding protein BtuD [Sinobacterium norvegicum]
MEVTPLLSADITLPLANFALAAEFTLRDNSITALFGHSGSGKTSLLKVLAGFDKTPGNNVRFKGQPWQDQQHFVPCHRRHIGYVFQQPQLLPHLTVLDNLRYAYRRRFHDDGPSIEELCRWLALDDLLSQYPGSLSGGQQQRVAIARTLASNPALILMDEPVSALDADSREEILNYLEQLHRRLSIAIVYVSHNIEEIHRLADDVIILQQGKIVQQGPVLELANLLDSPLHGRQHTLLEAEVCHYDSQWQLTTVNIGDNQTLQLSSHPTTIGHRLRLRIPASNVSITLAGGDNSSSIINYLDARIISIDEDDRGSALVRLDVQGQPLLAKLTRKSVHQLQLTPQQQVVAQIKGVAMLSDQARNISDASTL